LEKASKDHTNWQKTLIREDINFIGHFAKTVLSREFPEPFYFRLRKLVSLLDGYPTAQFAVGLYLISVVCSWKTTEEGEEGREDGGGGDFSP
jgi:hypothetical protein